MKVLVAGGAGYIGSVTVELLLQSGLEVVIYDNLSTGHPQAVAKGATLIEGDLADKGLLSRTFDRYGFDAVMHFAASILVGESMVDPAKYFTNNVANVITLLNVMLEHNVKKLVFSSSAAVYGEPDTVPISESAPLQPNNPYGETKLMVEKILGWYDLLLDLRYASLRYFNAAGASQALGEDHHPETHLIPIVLQVALGQRDQIVINGVDYPTPDGTCIRDYIHVVDLAQAHILALHHLDVGSQVYNLGNGTGYSNREVIEVARTVTSRPIKVVEGPRRPGDMAVLVARSQRAASELGWEPKYSDLKDIVQSAWEWHKQHPQGYEGG
jgi:UDP-glucose 4-epimerase